MPGDSSAENAELRQAVTICLSKCAEILEGAVDLDEATIGAAERWRAKIREDDLDPPAAAAALGIPFDASLFAVMAAWQIRAWHDAGGARHAPILEGTLEAWLDPDGSLVDGVVRGVVSAMADLAELEHGDGEDNGTGQAAARFSGLAALLLDAGRFDAALAASDAALTLLGSDVTQAGFSEAARLAVAAAEGTGEEDAIRVRRACLAAGLGVAAAAPDGQTTTFDAIEAAVRLLPTGEMPRLSAVGMLRMATAPDTPFHRLRLYLNLAVGAERPLDPLDPAALRKIAGLVSNLDPDAWRAVLEKLLPVLADIENARFAMAPAVRDDVVRTEWETFAFAHATFTEALPLHDSILRERNLEQLLFNIHHETTHVYSMRSGIGLAVTALRTAILDIEGRLWSFVPDIDRAERFRRFMSEGPAPLAGHELLPLAQAEQSLALTRKLQILQDLWQPWFEGVAVFAELADDPTTDPDARSDAITVLLNLFDPEHPAERAVADALDRLAAAERRYSEALGRSAYYALRSYLLDYPAHYVPGYLVVRSIVGGWRARREAALTGSGATRILLFLTRYGTFEAVPDLGLPVEEFRRAAAGNLRRWLGSIAAITAGDLDAILGAFPGSDGPVLLRWADGHVEPVSETIEEMSAEMERAAIERIRQALRSLTGAHPDPDRVSGAAAECRYVVGVSASSLGNARYDEASLAELHAAYWRALNVLVLARVKCPFWLNGASRQLALVVRVRRWDVADDLPRHKVLIVPLEPEAFDALVAETARLRSARMRVARVVDLVTSAHHPGRGLGRHVLAFRYGEWSSAFAVGAAWGAAVPEDLADEIAFALGDNPVLRLDREILATGRQAAERTREWIARATVWRESGIECAVAEWAAAVAATAEEVLRDQSARGDASLADGILLDLVLGDAGLAERVRTHGLAAFAPDEAARSALVRALDASGRFPVAEAPPAGAGRLFARTPHGYDVGPPAGAMKETPA